MPRRGRRPARKSRRRGGNRLYRTRRAPNSGITSLSLKRGLGMPDRFTTCLSFSHFRRLDTGASGVPVSQLYRGNSLFDPDFTGLLGKQPNYYDQISAMYNHYMVWGSKITVTITNVETSGNTCNMVVVLPTRGSTPSSTVNLSSEQPRARRRIMKDSSDRVVTIVNSARTKSILLAGPGGWNSRLVPQTNSNPLDVWFWIVQANSLNATDECVVECMINIKYYCTFYERTQVPAS